MHILLQFCWKIEFFYEAFWDFYYRKKQKGGQNIGDDFFFLFQKWNYFLNKTKIGIHIAIHFQLILSLLKYALLERDWK